MTVDLASGGSRWWHAAGDIIVNVENRGSDDADDLTAADDGGRLYGQHGDDTLTGGDGADTIRGGKGNDTIDGGDGADTRSGDLDDDTFVFGDGDTMTDFGRGDDRIDLFALDIAAASLASSVTITQDGEDAVVTVGEASITLTGVNVDNLGVDDFILG